MRPALQYLAGEIDSLERRGQLRAWPTPDAGLGGLDACSNDYLGYGAEVLRGGWEVATGARGSRLVVGDDLGVRLLEDEVANWVGQERALLFSSGYAANVGVVPALAGAGDLVVSDERNHASLIDGCRLSRASVRVVGHRALDDVTAALEEGSFRRRWVVVEGYYSMDGSCWELGQLRQVCDGAGAGLVVDEAHAMGVFGPEGAGACARAGIQPDVLVGTLGKAVGVQGAFVASDGPAVLWLWNRARSFVFSTGVSPVVARLALQNVRRARGDDAGRARLEALAAGLRLRLADGGVNVLGGSEGPIVPVVVGENSRCVAYELALCQRGIRVKAIRPPTVPEGTARLRVTVRASMSVQDVDALGEALVDCRP